MILSKLIPKMAMLTVAEDGVISAAAGDWKGIADVASSDLVGTSLNEVLPDAEREGETEFRGGAVPIKVSCALLAPAGGERHVIVSEGDELVKLGEAIARMVHPAVVGRMAANLAHEFNNLFSAIAGFVELAITTGKRETIEKALKVTEKNIERATKLSKALLQYGRRIDAESEVCNPASAIEEAFLLARKELEKAKVNAELNLGMHRDGVFDVGVVQYAFFVVLDNAKRFAGADGRIFVNLDFDKGNDEVYVSLADTGPGVPDEIKERIFEPFYSGPDDPEPGFGLGLTLARETLAQIGGRIGVEKSEGGLNTFSIVFPLHSSNVADAL